MLGSFLWRSLRYLWLLGFTEIRSLCGRLSILGSVWPYFIFGGLIAGNNLAQANPLTQTNTLQEYVYAASLDKMRGRSDVTLESDSLNAYKPRAYKSNASYLSSGPASRPSKRITARGDTNSFYGEHARGWFWYEPKAQNEIEEDFSYNENNYDRTIAIIGDEEPEQETPEQKINPQNEHVIIQEPEELQDLTGLDVRLPIPGLSFVKGRFFLEDLKKVRSRDLKVLVPKALEAAIDNPTEDKVYNYFFLQKLAMDKSANFAREAQLAFLMAPELDELPKTGASMEARMYKEEEKQLAQYEALKELAKRAGLVFYYKGSCQYCQLAASSINSLADLGFRIIAVSLDGERIPGLKAIREEEQEVPPQALGISSVPAIIYLEPHRLSKPKVIATGLVSQSELYMRIIRAGELNTEH